jgi:hypothetical protein
MASNGRAPLTGNNLKSALHQPYFFMFKKIRGLKLFSQQAVQIIVND